MPWLGKCSCALVDPMPSSCCCKVFTIGASEPWRTFARSSAACSSALGVVVVVLLAHDERVVPEQVRRLRAAEAVLLDIRLPTTWFSA
jgi:hypothetical protein